MSHIQAVLFDRRYNTTKTAAKWLHDNNLHPIKPFHVTDQYIRSRITEPHSPMRTIILDKKRAIKAVVNVQDGQGVYGRLTYRQTSRPHGGTIGSDLAVGTATVALPLLAFAAKKIYDKIRGGAIIYNTTYRGRSRFAPLIR